MKVILSAMNGGLKGTVEVPDEPRPRDILGYLAPNVTVCCWESDAYSSPEPNGLAGRMLVFRDTRRWEVLPDESTAPVYELMEVR